MQSIQRECLKQIQDFATVEKASKNARALLPKEPISLLESYLNGNSRLAKEVVVARRHSRFTKPALPEPDSFEFFVFTRVRDWAIGFRIIALCVILCPNIYIFLKIYFQCPLKEYLPNTKYKSTKKVQIFIKNIFLTVAKHEIHQLQQYFHQKDQDTEEIPAFHQLLMLPQLIGGQAELVDYAHW